jgi:hypothetical protein
VVVLKRERKKKKREKARVIGYRATYLYAHRGRKEWGAEAEGAGEG